MKHHYQKHLEKKVHFSFLLVVHHPGKPRQELRQELIQRLERKPACQLASSACSAWVLLLHPGLPTQGWHHPQWTEPSHLKHELRCPTGLPTGQS